MTHVRLAITTICVAVMAASATRGYAQTNTDTEYELTFFDVLSRPEGEDTARTAEHLADVAGLRERLSSEYKDNIYWDAINIAYIDNPYDLMTTLGSRIEKFNNIDNTDLLWDEIDTLIQDVADAHARGLRSVNLAIRQVLTIPAARETELDVKADALRLLIDIHTTINKAGDRLDQLKSIRDGMDRLELEQFIQRSKPLIQQPDAPGELPVAIIPGIIKVRPGRVLTADGVEIKTVVPRPSAIALYSTVSRDPQAALWFNREGKVTRVEITRSTGADNWDEPVRTALEQWTATGERIEQLEGELKLTVELLLRGDNN